jgi:hypothetical protein
MVFLNAQSRPQEIFFFLFLFLFFVLLRALKPAVASTALKVGAKRHKKRVGHKPGSVVGNHSSGMRVAAQL